jgi:hypothetical protein
MLIVSLCGAMLWAQQGQPECVVWTQDAVTKVQREEAPPAPAPTSAVLAAARNEFESFQVVVRANAALKDVDVAASDLTGPGGKTIPASAFTLYRVHYVDCQKQGWLPDSLVPFVDPNTGKRIGGKFGAPFEVAAGQNAPVWVELHVPADAGPGDYTGSVRVTVEGKVAKTVPLRVTVWPVTLPKTTTLLTFINLGRDNAKQIYLQSLHAHRMDPWYVIAINALGPRWTREGDKVVLTWNPAYDKAMDAYFDGSMFPDGVPGKSMLLAKFTGNIWKIFEQKEDYASFAQVFLHFEEHFKNKPYVSKLAWFLIDEPSPETIKRCIAMGKCIKENSPSIRNLLTTGYKKELEGLVDIWDPIINFEVIDSVSPGPDAYREQMKKGHMVINCVTCVSDRPTSPSLFIHGQGINTRIWPWVTFALDQQGIEFWDSAAAPSVTVPKKYGEKCWGDGSLFYKGLPEELGVPEEIALPSIRLKILRDGIEDSELLFMLKKKNPALAKKLCHRMAQETKDYDKSFEKPVQHTNWNWNKDGKGNRQEPGFVIYESSAERLNQARAAIAAELAKP